MKEKPIRPGPKVHKRSEGPVMMTMWDRMTMCGKSARSMAAPPRITDDWERVIAGIAPAD